jgi:hypothetical protein
MGIGQVRCTAGMRCVRSLLPLTTRASCSDDLIVIRGGMARKEIHDTPTESTGSSQCNNPIDVRRFA